MLMFQCGNLEIPLALVSGCSWTVSARTVERTGGYARSIGNDNVEISVRVVFSVPVVEELGLAVRPLFVQLQNLATECTDEPARLLFGNFEPVPSLMFALTSCNKTSTFDSAYDATVELDLVFSGVKVVKNEARDNTIAAMESAGILPDVSITRRTRDIKIRDGYSIDMLTVRDASVELGFTVRDDMSIISRDGFFVDMVDGETTVTVQNRTYHVISASIESNHVQIVGSFWGIDSQKPFVKSYRDTDLSVIFSDLAKRADVSLDCRVHGKVDYFLNTSSPQESIQSLCRSCGCLSLWRDGKLLLVDVPSVMRAGTVLDARVDASDDASEKITSCVWSDGLQSVSSGNTDGQGVSIYSVYAGDEKSAQCLARAKFEQKSVTVEAPVENGVESGSAVSVTVADATVNGLVMAFEADYMTNQAKYFVNYV